MQWEEFAAACPELATAAQQRFVADELVILGTIRRDGAPRISPCEVDFTAGRLLLGMMWQSHKALDLLRDPRLVVHSVPSDRMNPGGDVKLTGRAIEERDPAVREPFLVAIRERIDWVPEEPYHLFSLEVATAAHLRFSEEWFETRRWDPVAGLREERRPNS
jgi:hypothetical protein